uniref:Uncharacterized protein isoform X2 n=1 Tax=Nicotiana tabacum TaxID=4097 RepID=A0A1S3ZR28_TOBAC|nr:PREDICTED: uncharacterized protein LOC107789504 isoform X2 [Nicotiana tabacum]
MPPPLSPRPFSSQVLFFQKLLLNPSVFIKMSLSQLLRNFIFSMDCCYLLLLPSQFSVSLSILCFFRRHSFSIHSGYSETFFGAGDKRKNLEEEKGNMSFDQLFKCAN